MSYLNHEARQRVRQLREAMGLSRPKFADKLGVSPLTLKNYELGYREIGGGFLLLVANHNELKEFSPWLMTGTNPPQLIHTANDIKQSHQ
jgi:transcriptional regulator with XRE-family HTH domain